MSESQVDDVHSMGMLRLLCAALSRRMKTPCKIVISSFNFALPCRIQQLDIKLRMLEAKVSSARESSPADDLEALSGGDMPLPPVTAQQEQPCPNLHH